MTQKKIIAVFGATGAQGGGLARAILNDPNSEFAVRAVTRDPNSDKAQALADMGAEVVAGNLDDPESLKSVLDGAYGAYFVTFFWDHYSPEKEMADATHMAEAAQAAGLKHVIWSTLRTSVNLCRSTTTACRPCRENTKCRTLTARVRQTSILLRSRLLTC